MRGGVRRRMPAVRVSAVATVRADLRVSARMRLLACLCAESRQHRWRKLDDRRWLVGACNKGERRDWSIKAFSQDETNGQTFTRQPASSTAAKGDTCERESRSWEH